jgi:hypothetical protein
VSCMDYTRLSTSNVSCSRALAQKHDTLVDYAHTDRIYFLVASPQRYGLLNRTVAAPVLVVEI